MVNIHWAEQLANEIIAHKKPPFVISSGITTSGPAHLGTLCEFLYPSKIRDILVQKGYETKFYFVADILDAFDSIPIVMQQYEKQLAPHLGKPLASVPDFSGKSKSFGDHFLDEIKRIMEKFEVPCEVVRMNELYSSGKMDRYTKFFLENEKQAKEIVGRATKETKEINKNRKNKETEKAEETGKEEKTYWNPIMPVCAKCGKIATTRVLLHDGENYEYACDKEVGYTKGCGFVGKDSIYNHKYKLVWRLHWAVWQDLLGTDCEGAGVDHFTKGGSRDTLEAIFREMFKKEPSIGYKFGFILFKGQKYSKSKGIGMDMADITALLPPEVITFTLIRPDLDENKNINPTKENMLRAVEEYEQSQGFAEKKLEILDRAERKRALAYLLSGKRHWKALFRDILMYHSIYSDWEKTGEALKDKEGVVYLKPYIEEWTKRDFIPDELNFKYRPKKAEGYVREFFISLSEDADALSIHNAIFSFVKQKTIIPAELFRQIYLVLIGKERGPKLGKLIYALGINKIKRDIL
ncbi:MAG: lysine--tRNA ligase [Candidatus Micrarchaeota archaeon]